MALGTGAWAAGGASLLGLLITAGLSWEGKEAGAVCKNFEQFLGTEAIFASSWYERGQVV